MALGDVIRRLSVTLALDASEFATGSTKAQGQVGKLRDSIAGLGDMWMQTGKRLSVGVTLPVGGMLAGVVKVAGDFEVAMNKVSISTGATVDQLGEMREMATKLGADTLFGATEAADAMDMLAKNGLSATQIIEGAAQAAVNLATAAGSDLAPAADAITDVMAQFGLATRDLPAVVNQIAGAVNESKLDFDDFAGAIAQAGGVAGAAGVGFTDFNAVIAATSSLFASGSDAGTSFKTFITSLTGNSGPARAAIKELGLQFFDATGGMRSMADIAEELRTKLGGLNAEARTETLKTIFGTDAMRTAIGLMEQGADGIERVKAVIASTDASDQASKRMEGFAGAVDNLKGAFESLAIAVADTGLLQGITAVVSKVAGLVSWVSQAHPWVLKIGVAFGVMAAAIGPLMVVMGTLAVTVLPLFIGKLGLIGTAVAAFLNPIGTATVFLTRFALSLGGLGAVFTGLRVAMLALFANPVFLGAAAAVGGIYLAWQNWDKIAPRLQPLIDQLADIGIGLGLLQSQTQTASGELGRSFDEIRDRAVSSGAATEESAKRISDALGKMAAEGVVDPAATTAVTDLVYQMEQAGTIAPQEAEKVRKALRAAWTAQDVEGEKSGWRKLGEELSAFNDVAGTVFNDIETGSRDLGLAIYGNFTRPVADALSEGLDWVEKGSQRLGAAIRGFALAAPGWISGMVTGIRDALIGRLTSVWDTALKKIEEVRGAFFNLWDKVTRRSYVPDMVDDIAAEMRRLDQVMVSPVTAATTKAQKAFRDMADNTRDLLNRLFPEVRTLMDYRADIALIDQNEESKEFTKAQAVEARRRAGMAYAGVGLDEKTVPTFRDIGPLVPEMGKISDAIEGLTQKAKVSTVQIAKSFKDMADETMSALNNLYSSIKGGGFLDILQSVIGLGLQLGSAGAFGSKVATRINAPQMPQTVPLPTAIRAPSNDNAARTMNIAVEASPYFDVRVNGQIAQAAPSIARAGGQAGVSMMALKQSRVIGA